MAFEIILFTINIDDIWKYSEYTEMNELEVGGYCILLRRHSPCRGHRQNNLSTETCYIEKGYSQVFRCTYMTMCDSKRSLVEVLNMQITIYFGYVLFLWNMNPI